MKIVRTATFIKSLKKLGAAERDLQKLEDEIAENPDRGDVIAGLHGARKIRFAMKGRGKRGGGRAIYLVIWRHEETFLLYAYSKSEKSDLSAQDKAVLSAITLELTHEAADRSSGEEGPDQVR